MNLNMSGLGKLIGVLAIASVLLAGCGSSSSSGFGDPKKPSGQESEAITKQLEDLYDEAADSKESTVTVYGPGATSLEPFAKAFADRFPGMKVNLVNLVGADLVTRLSSEVTSKKHTADVVYGATTQGVIPEYEEWFDEFSPAGAGDLPTYAVDDGHLWHAPWSVPFGIVYDTARTDEAAAPDSWAELAQPEWKGRFGLDDPTVQSAASIALAVAYAEGKIDDDWITAVAANDPVIFASAADRSNSLLTGEVDASLNSVGNMFAEVANGAPLKVAAGATVTVPYAIAVMNGAPHPKLAELFSAWMLTPEAQEVNASIGQFGLMPDAPSPVVGLVPSEEVTADAFTTAYAAVQKQFGAALDR